MNFKSSIETFCQSFTFSNLLESVDYNCIDQYLFKQMEIENICAFRHLSVFLIL